MKKIKKAQLIQQLVNFEQLPKKKKRLPQSKEYFQKYYKKIKQEQIELEKRIRACQVPNSQPHLKPWKDKVNHD